MVRVSISMPICACVCNKVCVCICIVHMNPYAHLICGRNLDKCSCITRAWLQLPVPRGHEKWHPQSLAGWQLKSYALLQVSAYSCMRGCIRTCTCVHKYMCLLYIICAMCLLYMRDVCLLYMRAHYICVAFR